VISHFSYQERYRIYSVWKVGLISGNPNGLERVSSPSPRAYAGPQERRKINEVCSSPPCAHQPRYIFSRISADNVKKFARPIGKVCLASPSVLFVVMIDRILVRTVPEPPLTAVLPELHCARRRVAQVRDDARSRCPGLLPRGGASLPLGDYFISFSSQLPSIAMSAFN
jgi:hypothetical protein